MVSPVGYSSARRPTCNWSANYVENIANSVTYSITLLIHQTRRTCGQDWEIIRCTSQLSRINNTIRLIPIPIVIMDWHRTWHKTKNFAGFPASRLTDY